MKPQVRAHDHYVRAAFQAGHEGSIPFARSNQKTQLKPDIKDAPGSHQEAVPFLRARYVPDRLLAGPFRRTEASTSPMAAAIASSRSLVACW